MATTVEWKKMKLIFGKQTTTTRLKLFYLKRLRNIQNSNGKSLLHVAAKHGNLGFARFLVKIGCDINLKERKNQYTPLSRALYQGGKKCQRIVEFLVESGADVSWSNVTIGNQSTVVFEDPNMMNTLCSALCKREGGYSDADAPTATANYLLAKGWTLDNIACLKNQVMENPAFKSEVGAFYGKLMAAVAEQDVESVSELLVQNKFFSKRVLSYALLFAAGQTSSTTIVKLLLDYGAPVNGFPSDAGTPLNEAMMTNKVDNAKVLLDHGADVDKFEMPFLIVEGSTDQENLRSCIRLLIEHQGIRRGINVILRMQRDPRTNIWFRDDLGIDLLIVEYLSRHRRPTALEINIYEKKFLKYPFSKPNKFYEYFVHYVECFKEFRKMKHKVVEHLSLEKLLDKTIDEMVPLTRNEDLLNKLSSASLVEEFPFHGKTLQFKVDKALSKRLQIDQSIKILTKCLPSGLCDLVLEKIVFYLGVPNLLLLFPDED